MRRGSDWQSTPRASNSSSSPLITDSRVSSLAACKPEQCPDLGPAVVDTIPDDEGPSKPYQDLYILDTFFLPSEKDLKKKWF
jgi:hypothetical protein